MIGFILKLMLTKGVTMKRWTSFPKIEEVSHMDNIAFVIHVALFLSYLEEKNGNKVDREYIIKRIMFQSFSVLILSYMHAGTREYMKKIAPNIFEELEAKSYEYIFSKQILPYIKKDMEEVLSNNDKKLELDIIEASKKYVGYTEASVNARVYPDIYEFVFEEFDEYFNEKRKKLKSIDELLKNDDYGKYLGQIRRLIHTARWSGFKREYPISVMSHLLITTFIVYCLGMIEKNSGNKVDMEDILLRAMYHDIPEAMTGDVIVTTKNAIKEFPVVIEKVEVQMMEDYMLKYIPEDLRKNILNYTVHAFSSEDGIIVKYADNLSAFFEAKIESNFDSSIYLIPKRKLNKAELYSVNYFLKEILDEFDEDIENIVL